MGAALLQRKNRLIQDFAWWKHDFIGYTDGAWKFKNNSYTAGIGGCVIDKDKNLILVFSGSSSASSPRDSEKEAILFLFKTFHSQKTVQGRLQINTDCISIVDEFQRQRGGLSKIPESQDWVTLINSPGYTLKYIPREHLVGAHDLASSGASRIAMLHAWC